jgi:thiopeptide-type bacteriocin biosynthesis protein
VTAAPESRLWLSAYCDTSTPMYAAAFDAFIFDLVWPVTRECVRERHADAAFFVRYADPTPHVRIRLAYRNKAKYAALRSRFEEGIELRAAGRQAQPASDRPILTGVRFIEYEPEYDRYGGPDGVLVAEKLFCASSLFAASVLSDRAARAPDVRLAKGLVGFLSLLHAFATGRAHAVALASLHTQSYAKVYPGAEAKQILARIDERVSRQLPIVAAAASAAWDQMANGIGLGMPFDPYHRAAVSARRELRRLTLEKRLIGPRGQRSNLWEATHYLVASYAHMTSNRLGLTIPEEMYLAAMLSAALREEPAVGD